MRKNLMSRTYLRLSMLWCSYERDRSIASSIFTACTACIDALVFKYGQS